MSWAGVATDQMRGAGHAARETPDGVLFLLDLYGMIGAGHTLC